MPASLELQHELHLVVCDVDGLRTQPRLIHNGTVPAIVVLNTLQLLQPNSKELVNNVGVL